MELRVIIDVVLNKIQTLTYEECVFLVVCLFMLYTAFVMIKKILFHIASIARDLIFDSIKILLAFIVLTFVVPTPDTVQRFITYVLFSATLIKDGILSPLVTTFFKIKEMGDALEPVVETTIPIINNSSDGAGLLWNSLTVIYNLVTWSSNNATGNQ
jgi:hypothetical protein